MIQVAVAASNFSSYNSSKFAQLKMLEIVALENPDLHVVIMHPVVGMWILPQGENCPDTQVSVESEMSVKANKGKAVPVSDFDAVALPSHFAVWLCSSEARFLRGKFVWCNWDVEELCKKKSELENTPLLTANCIGWPYHP